MGHITIECRRGAERVETGLRGLPSLVQNGFMLKPKDVHVDPLQRSIEIDHVRFECSEAGAHQLEEALNTRYAAKLQDEGENAIEIKENSAASTGFDIRFVTVRAGARFEIKGHLSQEHLDVLQDAGKCELLQPGIVIRLSPPYLLIRRRHHDGSEEKMPDLPDTQYRRATALQHRRIFNHPAIRRTSTGQVHVSDAGEQRAEIREMRLVKNPQNKLLLWLECVTSKGDKPETKAFTHHNLADLQHGGAFVADLDVNLSLDHRTLSILNTQTNQDETITVDPGSSDSELARASQMLTTALKPPMAGPGEPSAEAHGVSLQTTTEAMSKAELKEAQDGPESQSPAETTGASSPGETQASAVGSSASAKGIQRDRRVPRPP